MLFSHDLDGAHVNFGMGHSYDSLVFFFFVTIGKPKPSVSWYWDKELLDESHDTFGTGVVRNRLLFGPLTRNHTNARIVCLATNHKLGTHVTTIFWINVQCEQLTNVIVIALVVVYLCLMICVF